VDNGMSENELSNDFTRFVVPIIPSSDGEVTVSLPANIASDMAGNGNEAAIDFKIYYDSTRPTVTITSKETDPTNNSPIIVDVLFSELVMGFDHADLEVTNGITGTANTTDSIMYQVPITPISDGLITASLPSGRTTDNAYNGNVASDVLAISYDGTPPSVIISCNESNPTNNSTFDISVLFSEPVEGFERPDMTVSNGTVGTILTSDNTIYAVQITPIEEGAVTISIGTGIAFDQAGNGNLTAEDFTITYALPNHVPSIEDQSFAIDENSVNGTVVGTVTASDEDGDDLAYIIEEGNTGNAFAIDGTTGELTVNASVALDYETQPEFQLTIKVFDGNGGTATAVITINLNDIDETPVTAIDDPGKTDFKLYPNPFGDHIAVESSLFRTEEYELRLYDPIGQTIQISAEQVSENKIRIRMHSLNPGIYFLAIQLNDETHIFSIVKQ
jgi:hypothetical protein